MAFLRNIDIERRAYIKLLLISTYSYQKISKLTKASTSSIARIKKTFDMESGQLIDKKTQSREIEEIKSSPRKTTCARY